MTDVQIVNDNEGTRTVQLSHKDGDVILHFERPVRWVALDGLTAGRLAEAMARASYTALAGDTPTPEKTQILDRIRARLVVRVTRMLEAFEHRQPKPHAKVQATEVVDQVLKEVA